MGALSFKTEFCNMAARYHRSVNRSQKLFNV